MPKTTAKERRARQKQNASRKKKESDERANPRNLDASFKVVQSPGHRPDGTELPSEIRGEVNPSIVSGGNTSAQCLDACYNDNDQNTKIAQQPTTTDDHNSGSKLPLPAVHP